MFEASRINLLVAHSAEAKPLNAMFDLRALSSHSSQSPFPVFHNNAGVTLIVSGMGKVAAASATAYLAGLQAPLPACAWLNIGIAGHQHAAVGTGMLAHKITDATTHGSFYPPQLIHGLPTSAVITVDVPEQQYPQDAAYDMEAAGFYACASRMVTAELVQVFKVISDNPQQPVAGFDISQVRSLLEGQRVQLQRLLADLNRLLDGYRAAYVPSAEYTGLLTRYQLTASQRVQLKRLCERYHALGLVDQLRAIDTRKFSTSKRLLAELEAGITELVQS